MQKKFIVFLVTMLSLSLLLTAEPVDVSGKNFANLPLYFIKNKGQVNKSVPFYARSSQYTLWAGKGELVFDSIKATSDNQMDRDVYRLQFMGADKNVPVTALDNNPLRVNYFKGKRENWHTDIPTSKAILYKNLYKGIDLKVYGIEKEVEYDWIVKANANPADIRLNYKNVENTCIDENGNIEIQTKFGKMHHKKPYAYQIIDGKKVEVTARFKKIGKKNENVYGFEVGEYDKESQLVIDPAVLVYSTYFGGTSVYEYVQDLYADGNGKMYFTGATCSTDFPTANAYDSSYYNSGNYDAYVSVIDTTESGSSSLVYSTYLGNNGVDQGHGITVDSSGIIYVTGTTWDGSSPYFPTTDSSTPAGGYDVIVFKLDTSETGSAQLTFSTIIGGTSTEVGRQIALDSSGNMIIAGYTQTAHNASTPFPITDIAYQSTKKGTYDFFLMKLSSSGSLLYSTYFGGGATSTDEAEGDRIYLALDSSDRVYLVGKARGSDFPIKPDPGALRTSIGSVDGFIAIFDTTAATDEASLLYSTYFGGAGFDEIWYILIDSDDIYITGRTESDSGTNAFPITTNAYDSTRSGYDAFVSKLSYDSSTNALSVDYCTYLGGSGTDYGRGLILDSNGYVYVCGKSASSDFPLDNSYQSCYSAHDNAFVSVLDITAGTSGLLFSSCLGGSGLDVATEIGLDSSGYIIVGGTTKSSNYPVTSSSAYQTTLKGGLDILVTVLDPGTL